MSFLLIVLLCLATFVMVGKGGTEIVSRKSYSLPRSKVKRLSWPSQQIIKAYYKLPKESQRYGNLYYMLSALDTKYGKGSVNSHFTKSGYDSSTKTFSVCRPSRYRYDENRFDCNYAEYHNIKYSIDEISAAHNNRLHAIEMAGIAGGLDAVEEFTAALREERDLIKETTRELM